MGFANAVVGGITLVRAAIRSPNFVAGASGWSINRDGSAEFNDVTLRAQLIVGVPPRYRFIGTAAPAELQAWATAHGVTLFMVDIWYLDSVAPQYVWEAIAIAGGIPFKVDAMYDTATGVSVISRTLFNISTPSVNIGSASFDSNTLNINYLDANVNFGQDVTVSWATDTLFNGAGWFYSHSIFTTATGTIDFAPFADYRGVVWEFLGGGAAGGSVSLAGAGTASCAGGGGAGGYGRCQVDMTAILAATSDGLIDITIGAAGAPAAAGNNNGGNGGTTIIAGDLSGTLVQATGGTGGQGGAANSTVGIATGGVGGVESYPGITGSHLNYQASSGGNGFRAPGGGALGGCGGASFYGGRVPCTDADAGGNGLSGLGFGSGGSGALDNPSGAANRQGGAGIAGYVITHIYK
jgi:hypothetical protein